MTSLRVNTSSRAYDIVFCDGDDAGAQAVIKTFLREDAVYVITNPTVKKYQQKALKKIIPQDTRIHWIVIPDGERYKTLATIAKIHEQMARLGGTRQSLILAFGGGVVGDMAGFVAATYMRGIDYIQIPTTLLSQVDSSVGGKTGVDLSLGKNLVGAFYQPRAVIMRATFLHTLPEREVLCGLAEVIKYGFIHDAAFFDLLIDKHAEILGRDPETLAKVIYRCCEIKAEIVGQDEKESGIRAHLNYGHTMGHAIEAVTGFSRIKHGEAIAMGMVFAARLSHALKHSARDFEQDTRRILDLYGLPTDAPKLPKTKIKTALLKDKKSTKKKVTFILLKDIGTVDRVPLEVGEILKCL